MSQSSCDCVDNYLCGVKTLNVLTSEQNLLIEMIDKIPNPQFQQEYIKKNMEFQK